MPSSPGMRDTMAEEIERFPAHRKVVDLGSGWGGLAARVARRYPDRDVLGLEAALVPFLFTKLWYRGRRKPKNLAFRRVDFRTLKPEEWTLYLAYLSPLSMETLQHQFEANPAGNIVLISALFSVRPWTPSKTIKARDLHGTAIYVYEIRGVGDFSTVH